MGNFEDVQVDEMINEEQEPVLEEEKKEKKNPFLALAEFYKESVDRADKDGFAEVYKRATELFFKVLQKGINRYSRHHIKLHVQDVEYLDGYFIFGHGTNSVVHFHLKETPGWKYGIWWFPKETKDSTRENPQYESDKLCCEAFMQYEEEIDKFKPTASTFGRSFTFYFSQNSCDYSFYEFCDDIWFIHKEPYLAFYREMKYTDFNQEYVSRAQAKRFYEQFHEKRRKQAEVKELNRVESLKAFKYIFGPAIQRDEVFLYDRGDNWSPRYAVIGKNLGQVDEDGCYDWWDFEWEDKKEDKALWDRVKKECEDRADAVDTCFWGIMHTSFGLHNPERYNQIKQECIADGSLVNLDEIK